MAGPYIHGTTQRIDQNAACNELDPLQLLRQIHQQALLRYKRSNAITRRKPNGRLMGSPRSFLGLKLNASLFLLVSVFAGAQCGVERTPVKTMRDPAAKQVNLRTPKKATVTQLRALPVPTKITNNLPRQESEKETYTVSAWLIGYKHESDSDFHLVISEVGDAKKTMIAEMPDPKCAPLFRTALKRERDTLLAMGHGAGSKLYRFPKPVIVQLVGVLFFDKTHGQTGVAPNGVELHPLLSLGANF
jgi:hypothetical protein